MAAEEPVWIQVGPTIRPQLVHDRVVVRVRGITQQPTIVASTRLSTSEMKRVSVLLRKWAQRSGLPEKKFSKDWVGHVATLISMFNDNTFPYPGDRLAEVEDILSKARGPYSNGHMYVNHESIAQDFINYAYSLVAGRQYQEMLQMSMDAVL